MKSVTIDGQIIHPKGDGIDHLNIYSRSKVELGRWLSNFSETNTSAGHGTFRTLEGYYHYLKIVLSVIDDDANPLSQKAYDDINQYLVDIKSADGVTAKKLGSTMRTICEANEVPVMRKPTAEMEEWFTEAVERKLKDNQVMLGRLRDIIEDGVPLTHYYDYGDSIIYKPHFKWLVDVYYNAINNIGE